MLLKTDAVVLKQSKFGEADMVLTLFAKKLGKIQAVAKGARKPRGKYTAGTQVFSYGEFVLYKGRDLYQISQVDIKQSFYELREDVERLAYAAYIIELTETIAQEGQTNNRLFPVLVECLEIMASIEVDIETLVKAYELKLLYFSGYKPELDQCVNCLKKEQIDFRFSSAHGGLLCKDCFAEDIYAMRITSTTINVMKYLINCDLHQVSRLKIRKNVYEELSKIIRHYIGTHLEKNRFKSLDFLDTIREKKY